MKPPFSYYGAKERMVADILRLIPPHSVYCEPYLGGGSVFWHKTPVNSELISDINDNLINFYRTVQKRLDFNRLHRMIQGTLHSRSDYKKAWEIYNNPQGYDNITRAWAFWLQTNMSFSKSPGTGWVYVKADYAASSNIARKKELFVSALNERLKATFIECCDAITAIIRADSKETFFYIDPPYVNADQGHYKGFGEFHFHQLLVILSQCKGKFLLSSYPSESLSIFCEKFGWSSHKFNKPVEVGRKKGVKRKTEVLTLNYQACVNRCLFEGMEPC